MSLLRFWINCSIGFMPAEPVYPQARYWILTIPYASFTPYLPPTICYIRGQLERGEQPNLAGRGGELGAGAQHGGDQDANRDGYLHWQLMVTFSRKIRLRGLKLIFGPTCHAEPSRSSAANDYVWKEHTRVEGTQFELGTSPLDRGNANDWEKIRDFAKRGELDSIPGDVYVRNYGNLRRIGQDNLAPVAIVRKVKVFWGATGTGKSRLAWNEAGLDAYPKDPRSKFWDGYRSHRHVVIDEFRGDIDVSHLLRWFDRYPVNVEIKGSSVVLSATDIWITSNLPPTSWYPQLDPMTLGALLRRLEIVEMN